MHRPEGYPALSAYLICPDVDSVIAFAEQVLGARLLRRFATEDGRVMHAEVRVDDSVFMIGDAGDEWPPVPTNLHVYVEDVDAVYARALEAGAVSVRAPESHEDGDRRGGVRDAGGNTWWFATMTAPAAT